jgi:hypothetical protein
MAYQNNAASLDTFLHAFNIGMKCYRGPVSELIKSLRQGIILFMVYGLFSGYKILKCESSIMIAYRTGERQYQRK